LQVSMSDDVAKSIGQAARKAFVSLLPKRRTVARALICAMVALLPLMLLVASRRPIHMAAFVAGCVGLAHLLGFGADIAKQLRWIRRMSARGPIVWGYHRLQRFSVAVGRKFLGEKLDVLPLAPCNVHASTIATTAAVLKWRATPTSIYSEEAYELQMAACVPGTDAPDAAAPNWVQVAAGLKEQQHTVGELQPDAIYLLRVRAANSCGASDWAEGSFRTRQVAVNGGGRGPGYLWTQTNNEIVVKVDLPAGTRAKNLKVATRKLELEVALDGRPLIAGTLWGPITSDETDWEIHDHKLLQITLMKERQQTDSILQAKASIWPSVLRGHPQIDTVALESEAKKEKADMDNEQLSQLMSQMNGAPED